MAFILLEKEVVETKQTGRGPSNAMNSLTIERSTKHGFTQQLLIPCKFQHQLGMLAFHALVRKFGLVSNVYLFTDVTFTHYGHGFPTTHSDPVVENLLPISRHSRIALTPFESATNIYTFTFGIRRGYMYGL